MDTRRDFLKKAALLSGAGGFLGLSQEVIQKAMAIDPEPGTTCFDAEHVVILMQENRSFDHCFGTLRGVRGFNDPRAIQLPNKKPVWFQSNARGETYAPFRLNIKDTKATWMGWLPHTWQSQVDARNGGKYDGWLEAKRSLNKSYADMPLTMGYYTREDVPFYYALADAFTVCDQHFCSSLTGTMPNRLHFWSGTIRGGDATAPAKVRNEEIEYESSASWTTFPERLEEHGIPWKIYQNELSLNVGLTKEEDAWLSNYGDNPLEWFTQYHVKFLPAYRKNLEKMIASLPGKIVGLEARLSTAGDTATESETTKLELAKAKALLQKYKEQRGRWSPENFEKLSAREKTLHEKAFCTNVNDPAYHELATLRYRDGENERQMKIPKGDILFQFRQDVESGKLPAVSWIVAPEHLSDHPESAWYGAWYTSEVLSILTRKSEVWKKTIFILTYDENDGYFDHAPPFVAPDPRNPESGAATPGIDTAMEYVTMEQETKRHAKRDSREGPIGLGYRVPMVIASPWSRGGYACSQVFDHTSVLQFLEKFASQKAGKQIEETNISKWRRAVCGDLTSAFRPYNGEEVKLPEFLSKEPFVEGIHQAQFKKVPFGYKPLTKADIERGMRNPSTCPWMPAQEPGTRPSCGLPYQLHADGTLNRKDGAFEIVFTAEKGIFGDRSAGAPFTVYCPRKYRRAGSDAAAVEWEELKNWSFAVQAGTQIKYAWPLSRFEEGAYHLLVHGPNGFFRESRGRADDLLLEAGFEYEQEQNRLTGNIRLTFASTADRAPLRVTLKDNAYQSPARLVEIPPHGREVLVVDCGKSFGWYDFSLLCAGSELYLRRYAGRVETGRAGISDPAMGRVS